MKACRKCLHIFGQKRPLVPLNSCHIPPAKEIRTEGLVSYEITSLDISGEIPIQRISLDNVALCEAL
jgi:hypothetical protein